ncbi:MAG: Flp pilus assembly complex ATPase component TadA [Clostridia bacterium]|nr:Flp pilus assembly complex ATPase component TadA [Clostridia bacterium]
MERLLSKLLPLSIYNELYKVCNVAELSEIRIRAGKPVYYAINGRYKKLGNGEITINTVEIEQILSRATKSSIYAYNSNILDGFITYDGGIRIGLTGEGVIKSGDLRAVKNITSLCIRIPHYIEIRDKRIDEVIKNFRNTLIISKPGYGKTTLLRYMIRRLSEDGYNVLALDERGELSGISDGKQTIDLGECTDLALGIPKISAYASQVRSMRPDIIATDEIFGEKEIDCIADCVRCGVKVIATVHSDDLANLKKSALYSRLLDHIGYVVSIVGIGNIDRVVDLRQR